MPIVNVTRIIKFAFQNFTRNIWLSLVTIFILFLTLFSITLSRSLNLIAGQAIAAVKDRVEVSVYFQPDALEENVKEVQQAITAIPEVKDVTYISRDQALAAFKEQTHSNSVVQETLDILGENPLGATLVIKARNIGDYPKILAVLDKPDFAELIHDKDFAENQAVIERLSSMTDRIQIIGLVVSGIFTIVAFLVMFNTIRIAIYAYREEIGIMKLVGATNWFVRAPFVVETILYALIAAAIVIGVITLLVGVSAPYMSSFFTGYSFDLIGYFETHLASFFLVPFIAGLGLAILSSLIAVGRYLRV